MVDKKCELIKNSSDAFIQDLTLAIRKCIPGIKPLVSAQATKNLRKFSNPHSSMLIRRRMIKQKGVFLSFLGNI